MMYLALTVSARSYRKIQQNWKCMFVCMVFRFVFYCSCVRCRSCICWHKHILVPSLCRCEWQRWGTFINKQYWNEQLRGCVCVTVCISFVCMLFHFCIFVCLYSHILTSYNQLFTFDFIIIINHTMFSLSTLSCSRM